MYLLLWNGSRPFINQIKQQLQCKCTRDTPRLITGNKIVNVTTDNSNPVSTDGRTKCSLNSTLLYMYLDYLSIRGFFNSRVKFIWLHYIWVNKINSREYKSSKILKNFNFSPKTFSLYLLSSVNSFKLISSQIQSLN